MRSFTSNIIASIVTFEVSFIKIGHLDCLRLSFEGVHRVITIDNKLEVVDVKECFFKIKILEEDCMKEEPSYLYLVEGRSFQT